MRRLFILPVFVMLLASCIREELPPCPPMQIDITVKDKNYFNVHAEQDLEKPKEENLPFKEYIQTLYYKVTEVATGKVIQERKTFQVSGDRKEVRITMPETLPYGKYAVTVWGNIRSERPLGDDVTYDDMNAVNAAANDVYVTQDTLDYQVEQNHFKVDMERTKGKLLIQVENVPDYINFSTKNITNIFQYVGTSLNYTGKTDVSTDSVWEQKNAILTKTLMCPSTSMKASTLQIKFQGQERGAATLNPEDIQITMSRNALTIVRYIYKEENEFDIFVMIDDNWEKIHGMEID